MTSSAATIHPHAALDIWQRLAAPIPPGIVQWRQQGRGKPRDGKHYAPFVAYIDAQFVRQRLDEVVSGEWDLSLELLPPAVTGDGEEIEPVAFKARLQILGVIREDVGSGKDYKTAATDAFKRAAVRFGIAHELYTDYEIVWVRVDGDGKYAKAVEDPAEVWARKSGSPLPQGVRAMSKSTPAPARETAEYDALKQGAPAQSRASSDVSGKRMPFGKKKGTLLVDMEDKDLESTIAWCREKDAGKFKDLIAACELVLTDRALEKAGVVGEPEDDELPF